MSAKAGRDSVMAMFIQYMYCSPCVCVEALENVICWSPQTRGCGDDDDTQAQDDELSLSANEVPQGSDGGESFILDLPGQPQDQLRVSDYSANLDYYQPPLDFLDPNCLPR